MADKYTPNPIDTSNIELSDEILKLSEDLARNVHEVWAAGRIADGWIYGTTRDDVKRETPCLVPYEQLTEEEREYDRATAIATLKFIVYQGFKILKK